MSTGTDTQALEIEEDEEELQQNGEGGAIRAEEFWGELIRTSTMDRQGQAQDAVKHVLEGPHDRRFIIGRDKMADIRIDDQHVSSKHCILFRDENNYVWVEDTSLSGTYVNGERVQKNTRKRLNNGDSLCLLRPAGPTSATPKTPNTPGRKTAKPNHCYEFVFRSSMQKPLPCKGEINDTYEVMDVLGSGSFATVRRGVNKLTGEEVAVKIVERKNFQFEPERWRDQLKEIEMLKRLNHDGCVRLLDTYMTDDAIYIVMEFVRGGELFDRIIARGKLSESATRVLVRRLLQAVAYLHDQGIVHRDLKPENILLLHKEDHCYHIKVADFGVARLVGAGCKTLTGSLSYIAPEVLERRDTVLALGTYDYACDLWSVGVIVYVCLLGRLPFKTSADDEHVVQDLKRAAKILVEFRGNEWGAISDSAKDFLRKLFTISTQERLTARGALEHPWIMGAPKFAEDEKCFAPSTSLTISQGSSLHSELGDYEMEEDGSDASGMRKRNKAAHPPVPPFSQ